LATKALSSRQKRIIIFIHEFLRDKGYPPSIRDIADRCEISSTSVVAYNLDRLEEAGYIRRHSDVSRGIELLINKQQDSKRVVYIPIVGRIAAGEPIPVPASDSWNIPSSEGIEVAEELTKGKQVYALRVKGNSMVDALIKDGDIVLMDFVSSVAEGEMAAVWLKTEQEVTLKKVFTEPDRIRLEPANTQMKPIYASSGNVEIQGKVIAVIRAVP
jgi:repressor LexA